MVKKLRPSVFMESDLDNVSIRISSFIQDFTDGGGLPGAMEDFFLQWRNKKVSFTILESFQKLFEINEEFLNF